MSDEAYKLAFEAAEDRFRFTYGRDHGDSVENRAKVLFDHLAKREQAAFAAEAQVKQLQQRLDNTRSSLSNLVEAAEWRGK